MKYPIKKEFFPFSRIAPPIQNAKMAGWMGSKMRVPGWIYKDKDVSVSKRAISGYGGAQINIYIFEPKGNEGETPCLVYYHRGGFFFEGAGYHYRLAKEYAIQTPCKVAFVQYRLAPKHPHPTPAEDCFAALQWVFAHGEELHIDRGRIGVGGDSAGGALAAAVCQMARDRNLERPVFQLLVYPVTDRRMNSESNRKYTDTPMWNSRLSEKMWQGYVQDDSVANIAYASPMEAESFDDLPAAYVETAEFDCLHDEGIDYAKALMQAGSEVTLNETCGTMHGFDIVQKAETAKAAVQARISYMKSQFNLACK